MSVTLDGREVKAGDKLWSPTFGWGEVINLEGDDPDCFFEIYFKSLHHESAEFFTVANGAYRPGLPRSLFWGEVKIDPPKPVKVPVKKWRWAIVMLDAGHEYTHVTKPLSEEEIGRCYRSCSVLGKVEWTEVEE